MEAPFLEEPKDILMLTQTAHHYTGVQDSFVNKDYNVMMVFNDKERLGPILKGIERYALIICECTENRDLGEVMYKEVRGRVDLPVYLETLPFLVVGDDTWAKKAKSEYQDENLHLLSGVDFTHGKKSKGVFDIKREALRILG